MLRDYDYDYDYEDDRAYEARLDAAAERGRTTYRYNCGGRANYNGPCGASDCGSCRNGAPPWAEEDGEGEQTSSWTCSYRIASKDGVSIKKGDLYRRTTRFTYIEGGRRTGYEALKMLVARGPAHEHHDPATWESGMKHRELQLRRRRTRR